MSPEQWREWRLRNFDTRRKAAAGLGICYDYMKKIELGRRTPGHTLVLAAMALEAFGPGPVDYVGEVLRVHFPDPGPLRTEVRRERDRQRREALSPLERSERWRPPRLGR